MWQTYLWTSVDIVFMIIFWIFYAQEMKKEEKKRSKTFVKVYLWGSIFFTLIAIAGIGLSIMEFKDPYYPPPPPEFL